jgi:hypothetical protein
VKGTIVVAGALAQRPFIGGHTWVFLQYLLGFRRLGWNVVFLDRIEPDMCVDAAGNPASLEDSINLRYLRDVMQRFGLGDSFALLYDGGRQSVGLSRAEVLDRVSGAAFLLNVMGFVDDEDVLAAAQRRVFLDIDPGFGQIWLDLGLHNVFAGHDDFVTIGENIGREGCEIPTCGLEWITTPQPVVLECWPVVQERGPFTSIATWRGAFAPLEYRGKTYGLRVHEFRKYFSMPTLSGQPFELALDIHPAEEKDIQALRDNGWQLVDPREVAADTESYREYIGRSGAEFMVAKSMYVDMHSGWLSDRSLCYLASGKPVVAQDTGLADLYRTGEGLLTFDDPESALQGVREIADNFDRHASAARALAEEYFDSDVVLSRLLNRLGVA